LGKDTVAGSRIWDVQNRFRFQLGPIAYEDFLEFLPDPKEKKLRQLIDITRRYVGPQFDFDVQVLVRFEDIPPLQLGSATARLGWSTWLGTSSDRPVADDAIFQLPDQM
jgi:type VI secretion system protein ImpH